MTLRHSSKVPRATLVERAHLALEAQILLHVTTFITVASATRSLTVYGANARVDGSLDRARVTYRVAPSRLSKRGRLDRLRFIGSPMTR